MKRLLMAAGAALVLGAPVLGFPALAHAETACGDLKSAKLDHAEVTSATVEKAGQVEVCKVAVTSRPTKDSDIRIELYIPLGSAWNGKYLQTGNGGFAGSIASGRLKAMAAGGYAVSGTDNGHQVPVGTSAAWALGHPEKLVDFGWRSLKETTDVSKALIRAQKGEPLKRSYFFGCSDGGREALMEAQRFPKDFDGIVAGAPANYMSLLFGNGAAQQQALARPGAYLDKPQLEILQAGALKQCGDGSPFIRDPGACRFDPGALQCKAGQTDGCLTAAQVGAARDIYAGRRDPRNGKIALPGVSPGAEAVSGGWQAWITGPSQARNANAAGSQFSSNAFKYFAFADPSFDFLKLDMGAQFDRAKARMGPTIDSDSPNLKAFKAHGGKLIQYHGSNDPAIPSRSSVVYYEDVGRTMGRTDDFYRLFLVPGMLHCGSGPGPGNVDWVAALDGWVSEGKSPTSLVAKAGPSNPVQSQLLCPYPAVAKGSGADAGGYKCVAPKTRS